MTTKADFITTEFPKLNFYTSQILKVHGAHHPELGTVRELFVDIATKIDADPEADLTAELGQLAVVTDNYTVPADGCEAYQATYELLADFQQIA
ncbi:hypothetical protein [Loigolactobacillus jiayinensis]|uniref:Iron-sulfur cluster repair di-iron protein, ric n=1 Tax=Loigolactobacillus jiayinensis TaxID=2486016 RepID=A0ABW1RGE8_9LACO|nr:hypothetical protein [Loigolactobacillus jiayinensis]